MYLYIYNILAYYIWAANLLHVLYVQGGADKSFALLGRKQATANKLGIYSTYSP